MASLLDYLNRFGDGAQRVMDRLVTPDLAIDPAMEAMMTPEQVKAAQRQARSAGIAGMARAADAGAHWTALRSEQNLAGQGAYNSYLGNAVASVEELRKRRDSEGRRKAIAELVGRLSNPEDPLTQQYTPEQIAVLGALDPDAQAALLAKSAFPKESGVSIASAGSVQKVVKLANGNIGVVVQTGDPQEPAVVKDLGTPYVSELPSDIRSLLELGRNPELIATAEELEKRKKTGAETGGANVKVMTELPALIATNQRHVEQLEQLRDKVGALDSGALTGRVLQQFSSEFQTAQAMMYEEALLQIGALKAAGASLNPITEKELEILFTTSPKLTNQPKANVQIINTRIQRIQRVMEDLQAQLDAARAGDVTDYNPGVRPPPAPALRPGDVANPPPGGPGSVSKIPVLPQHRQRP